jgi:predicted esterase/outer membrane protein assembly factor BamD (BamD/ComL family)
MTSKSVVAVACLALAGVAGLWDGVAASADATSKPTSKPTFEVKPGKETKIVFNETTGAYYLVFVPQDYTPDRAWPVVFFYHGMNNEAMCWPWRQVTGDKGFIVVGMEYTKDGKAVSSGTDKEEVAWLMQVADVVEANLKVDKNLMFLSGFSKGGFHTIRFAEMTWKMWAGVAIMGAGGSEKKGPLAGKPIYIGIGETDPSNAAAKKLADDYKARGGDVTLDEYKGMGHAADGNSKIMHDWLMTNGPLKQVKADLAEAKKDEDAGKLGAAYALYTKVAHLTAAGDDAKAAAKSADALTQSAKSQLAEAQTALTEKKYPQAIKLLTAIDAKFSDCAFGDQAKKQLKDLRADAGIQAEIQKAELNAKADLLEGQAKTAETARDFVKALAMYDQYLATYPKSDRFEAVKTHVAELRADKSITGDVAKKTAEKDCSSWLALADNFITSGSPDKAKAYLQMVLDKYPGTDWAAKAKERLDKLPK